MRLIAICMPMVLPIVIWIMEDQCSAVPVEREEATLVDGLSDWRAFLRIIVPPALPGMVAASIASRLWMATPPPNQLAHSNRPTRPRHGRGVL